MKSEDNDFPDFQISAFQHFVVVVVVVVVVVD